MNRKGFSLLTALILAFIALAFTGALLYMTTKSTRVSGIGKRYTNSIEAAKGVTRYLETLMSYNVLCGKYTNCENCTKPNCQQPITIDKSIYDSIYGSGYNATATLLGYVPIYDSKGEIVSHIYSIRITVRSNETSEKSIVDFVYKAY